MSASSPSFHSLTCPKHSNRHHSPFRKAPPSLPRSRNLRRNPQRPRYRKPKRPSSLRLRIRSSLRLGARLSLRLRRLLLRLRRPSSLRPRLQSLPKCHPLLPKLVLERKRCDTQVFLRHHTDLHLKGLVKSRPNYSVESQSWNEEGKSSLYRHFFQV